MKTAIVRPWVLRMISVITPSWRLKGVDGSVEMIKRTICGQSRYGNKEIAFFQLQSLENISSVLLRCVNLSMACNYETGLFWQLTVCNVSKTMPFALDLFIYHVTSTVRWEVFMACSRGIGLLF